MEGPAAPDVVREVEVGIAVVVQVGPPGDEAEAWRAGPTQDVGHILEAAVAETAEELAGDLVLRPRKASDAAVVRDEDVEHAVPVVVRERGGDRMRTFDGRESGCGGDVGEVLAGVVVEQHRAVIGEHEQVGPPVVVDIGERGAARLAADERHPVRQRRGLEPPVAQAPVQDARTALVGEIEVLVAVTVHVTPRLPRDEVLPLLIEGAGQGTRPDPAPFGGVHEQGRSGLSLGQRRAAGERARCTAKRQGETDGHD